MTLGRGTVFQPNSFVFKPDFDHGMLACHDMFDMFSLTCLSCDMGIMGAWHSPRGCLQVCPRVSHQV